MDINYFRLKQKKLTFYEIQNKNIKNKYIQVF